MRILIPLAVRARTVADDAGLRAAEGLSRRVARLRDDGEAGSQVAEYALIGGVGATACAVLVRLLQDTDLLQSLLSAVVNALIRAVRSWF
ncbi:MAG TPA: hypothetical protein VIK95_01710 [Egibacteraceae bacterium]